uniref:CMT1A duplicated region transcript 4 protein n=1 Tax=Capra hircus TaxID=9925 RepID=A0A8C2P8D2_CAPHI
MERLDARKMKMEEELTENIGLPVNLLDKHDPWPAYVTYTSPMVKRLIEKSKARELECLQTVEESRRGGKQSKPASLIQLKRRKSSKSSGTATFKDLRVGSSWQNTHYRTTTTISTCKSITMTVTITTTDTTTTITTTITVIIFITTTTTISITTTFTTSIRPRHL